MTYEELLPVRGKPYNMKTIFRDGARGLKTKGLIIHLPARVMPTLAGRGVLDGNQINNS